LAPNKASQTRWLFSFTYILFYYLACKEMWHKIPTTEKKTSAPFKSSHFHKHFHKRKKDRQENLFFFWARERQRKNSLGRQIFEKMVP
jgi:hypothetical protein